MTRDGVPGGALVGRGRELRGDARSRGIGVGAALGARGLGVRVQHVPGAQVLGARLRGVRGRVEGVREMRVGAGGPSAGGYGVTGVTGMGGRKGAGRRGSGRQGSDGGVRVSRSGTIAGRRGSGRQGSDGGVRVSRSGTSAGRPVGGRAVPGAIRLARRRVAGQPASAGAGIRIRPEEAAERRVGVLPGHGESATRKRAPG